MGFDAGRPESLHGPTCKKPSKTVQMRHNVFEGQVAQRYSQEKVVSKAKLLMGLNDEDSQENAGDDSYRASRFEVYRIRRANGLIVEGMRWKVKSNNHLKIEDDVTSILVQKRRVNLAILNASQSSNVTMSYIALIPTIVRADDGRTGSM